ncbi:transcriptional regulator, TetR family [Nocardioides terrae]|uniref:Transcriptional regulator, TetR family n=1 Tax=Nocardioides terrae TaxID=574651 RepID=A0A1I1NWX0_9ACTN|nr:TetR/AcrR family transcriptional regulator [Nocardioides terrae]SFD02181.1 transcriptional regulator, TetR family [Nocardioides terrae]
MANSANPSKRELTAHAIALCAQRLADEHGLDGFTMDQLAEAAGVSRRTLFNYYPGKLDAVLGEDKEPDPALFAAFTAGGPTGELIGDLRLLITGFLEANETDAEAVARFRRLLVADPRIFHAAHGRFERATAHFTELIGTRADAGLGAREAGILARLILSLFDQALADFVEDPESGLTHHFNQTFETVQRLLGRSDN